MNVDRMQQLVRVLLEVEAQGKHFNIGCWSRQESCGTVACAVGWAARDKWHNGQGLSLVADTSGYGQYDGPHFIPAYSVFSDTDAVAEYFEIPATHVTYFFYAHSYRKLDGNPVTYGDTVKSITVREVIDRLQNFLGEKAYPEKGVAVAVAEPPAVEELAAVSVAVLETV